MHKLSQMVSGVLLVCATLSLRADEGQDLSAVLKADGRYTIFVTALEDTGLNAELKTLGLVTVFAPTDEAFQRVPKMAELLANREKLKNVLRRHIVSGKRLDRGGLKEMAQLTPLQGDVLKITRQNSDVYVLDAKVVHIEHLFKDGIAHGVDHLFMEGNSSAVREAGETIESNVKYGAKKVYEGLKTGTEKIKDAFDD